MKNSSFPCPPVVAAYHRKGLAGVVQSTGSYRL